MLETLHGVRNAGCRPTRYRTESPH